MFCLKLIKIFGKKKKIERKKKQGTRWPTIAFSCWWLSVCNFGFYVVHHLPRLKSQLAIWHFIKSMQKTLNCRLKCRCLSASAPSNRFSILSHKKQKQKTLWYSVLRETQVIPDRTVLSVKCLLHFHNTWRFDFNFELFYFWFSFFIAKHWCRKTAIGKRTKFNAMYTSICIMQR